MLGGRFEGPVPWLDTFTTMLMDNPFFSVIVPVYERQKELGECLAALSDLDYPRELLEVLIVDDGSFSPPGQIVAAYSHKMNVRLIVQQHAGPAAARNNGASQAKGDFLAFTDSDCAPGRNWLKEMASEFARTPDAVIGGRTINRLHENVYSAASQLIIDYLYSYYNAENGRARFFASNNLALPAAVLRSAGGFDPGFSLAAAEDRDLCDRLLFQGYKLLYVPKAVVYHSHFLDLKSFMRQHYDYGNGAFMLHEVREKRNGKDADNEPVFFYIRLVGYPLFQKQGLRTIPLTVLMGLSQIVNAVGFYSARFFRSDKGCLRPRGDPQSD